MRIRISVSLYLREEDLKDLDELKRRKGISRSQKVRDIVEEHIAKRKLD